MKSIKIFSLVALMTAMLSACIVINDAALILNEGKWRNAEIESYEFTVQETCGVSIPNCQTFVALPFYKVTVLNGAVSHVQSLLNETMHSGDYPHLLDATWAKPFNVFFTQVKQKLYAQQNHLVVFDPEYGFITKALNFEVKSFKKLKHTAYNKEFLEQVSARWRSHWTPEFRQYLGVDGYQFTVYENCGEEICPELLYPAYKVTVLHDEVIDVTHIYPELQSDDAVWALTVEDMHMTLLSRLDALDDERLQAYDMGNIYKAINFVVSDFRVISEDYLAQEARLNNAYQVWLDQGLQDYRLTYTLGCFCIFPSLDYGETLGATWDITVRQGKVHSATANGIEQASALTMDELYERVIEANVFALFTRIDFGDDGHLSNVRIERDYLGSDGHTDYTGIQITPL